MLRFARIAFSRALVIYRYDSGELFRGIAINIKAGTDIVVIMLGNVEKRVLVKLSRTTNDIFLG